MSKAMVGLQIFDEPVEEEFVRLLKFASTKKIREFINKNSSVCLHYPTWTLQTPLTACIDRGDQQILSLLLEKIPTNLNETLTQACGRNLLMYAAFNTKDTEILQILVKNGADPNKTDMRGWTCLQYAIAGKRLNNIIFLKDVGMDINVRDLEGRTPLMISILVSNQEIMTYLLDHGADIDACDKIGFTALHLAIMYRNREAAILLMQRNADTTRLLPVSKTSIFELVQITMPNFLPALKLKPTKFK